VFELTYADIEVLSMKITEVLTPSVGELKSDIRSNKIVVSDTFDQFAGPLMKKLGWPTLFCHTLSINPDGSIAGYKLRQKDSKREAVISLKSLKYDTIAVGDSYNDITMLKEADNAILFDPPENVKNEFPAFPVSYNYDDLKDIIQKILSNDFK
jgi:phosphoserine/homoserine phosphotransferase